MIGDILAVLFVIGVVCVFAVLMMPKIHRDSKIVSNPEPPISDVRRYYTRETIRKYDPALAMWLDHVDPVDWKPSGYWSAF